jgi:uncharacterized OB-fold protein
MSEGAITIAVDLHLAYRHPLGALSPYFRALTEGRALAPCWGGHTYFPPRLPPDGSEPGWIELTGHGTVVAMTRSEGAVSSSGDASATSVCVLVSMDGADNLAVGRVRDPQSLQPGDRLQISVGQHFTPNFPLSLNFKRAA